MGKETGLTPRIPKKKRRQDRILEALERDPAMRVNELARQLEVSQETVRRDLNELDASGRIRRTYGGAVRTNSFEPDLSERLKLHIEPRERISRLALNLMGESESLFIGGGATTLHFARALKPIDRRLTVLTASFGIATELSANPLIEVIFLPGRVEPREGLVYGPETLQYIGRYRTPLAIMGASAVDELGVSEALLNSAQVYEEMVRSADHTMVLADSSKMGSRSLRMIFRWNPKTSLLTEREPDADLRAAIEGAGASLLVTPSEA